MEGDKGGVMLPAVALLGAMLLWGSSFIAMKVAVMALHPLLVILARMVVASALLCLAWRSLAKVRYHKGDWKPLLFMALCEPCLYFLFESYALRHTSASQAGMVAATLPVLVAVSARFFLAERLGRTAWAGLMLAILGVALLSATGQATDHAPNPALGNFLEFLAMATASGYMVTLKRLTQRYPPWFLTAVQTFAGAVFFLPVLLLPQAVLPDPLPMAAVWSVLYLGSFVTIGAFVLFNFGMSRLPAGQTSAYVNLIPVITLILGKVMLDEVFTPAQYAASALVLVGVYLSQRRPRPAS